jgi:cytochrome c oxidase subunit 3
MQAAQAAQLAQAVPDARKVGLWVFMGVVTSLFMLFSVAYVMRMAMTDWQPLRYVPWQLWLSTAVLALASAAWERARRNGVRIATAAGVAPGAPSGAAPGAASAVRAALLACGLSLAFLAVQLWAWQAMTDMRFTVNGNPASSFFYLLTGLHGLHVGGGLVAAALAGAAARRSTKGAPGARAQAAFAASAALCARYWHFLLLLWLALFALMFLVTPDFVQVVCESVGIRPPQAR